MTHALRPRSAAIKPTWVTFAQAGGCTSMAVLASAQMGGCRSRDRTTLQRTDASQMNATDVMLAELATAHGASMVDENVPDAPPSPSFDYSRVIEALAGSART